MKYIKYIINIFNIFLFLEKNVQNKKQFYIKEYI